MVHDGLDHGRRFLHRRVRRWNLWRSRHGRRFAGEESLGEIGEQPCHSESARDAPQGRHTNDQDGSVPSQLTGTRSHQLSGDGVGHGLRGARLGEGEGLGAADGVGFGCCFGGGS